MTDEQITLEEMDRQDVEKAIDVPIEMQETGKADADFLRYIGMLLLSMAERMPQ